MINQGLVRFLSPDGDHDTRTDEVIARIQAGGVAWFGGATAGGRRVMRMSVCNWRTTDARRGAHTRVGPEVLAAEPAPR